MRSSTSYKLNTAIVLMTILSMVMAAWSPTRAAATTPERPANMALRGAIVSQPVTPADTAGLPVAPSVNPATLRREASALKRPPHSLASQSMPGFVDPVRQAEAGALGIPDPLINFEGQDIAAGGGYAPPDTNGQVGPNHYVQMVNVTTAVYDKKGTLLYGPFLPGSLWPAGDPCSANDGDPVVLYDQLADRWLLTQFAVSGPYYQCIAVSKGPVPTNNPNDWYPYTFLVSNTKMNDYPKLGVWPDGYYTTANQFDSGWGGLGAWVFEREKMLAGQPATFQYFDIGLSNPAYSSALPSNWMGSTPPPVGAPNYFTSVDQDWSGTDDILHLWEFHVDWANPANTTFTLVKDLVVAPFEWDLCDSSNCIDQPGVSTKLDAINDRLMMHLWYRNFGDHESLVVNHTVDGDGLNHAGIRWYEIRSPGANASIYQQGTYQPDTSHRWMGSVAMDAVGNMALGYSVSDATATYPSVRYTGRLASDPLGSMPQGEVTLMAGTGSQTSPSRWGDYSSMTVDPLDDCTFWYTTEYIAQTGGWNWQTRIGAFKFPTCTLGPAGDLTGTVTNASGGALLSGIRISATASPTQTFSTASDIGGQYALKLPVATYQVSASGFGFMPQTVDHVEVLSGTTTVLNFAMQPAVVHPISGQVTDGTTGWPLYAKIAIDGYPGAPIWTDPATGQYSITLPEGITYTFKVSSFVAGYQTTRQTVGPLGGSIVQNFALAADLRACTAPGYAENVADLFAENFDAAVPPDLPGGWDKVQVVGSTAAWATNAGTIHPAGAAAHTPPNLVFLNSWSASQDDSTRLFRLNGVDLSGVATARASFWVYHDTGYTSLDRIQVQVSTDGGVNWANVGEPVARYDGSTGWAQHRVYLDGYTGAGMADVRLGFLGISQFGNDVHLDDVSVQLVDCAPRPGGLVVGHVYDANTGQPVNGAQVSNSSGQLVVTMPTPDDPRLPDAFYTIFSLAGSQPHTYTQRSYHQSSIPVNVTAGEAVAQDFDLPAGRVTASPAQFDFSVEGGTSVTRQFTLANIGGWEAAFKLSSAARRPIAAGPRELPRNGVVKPWRQAYPTARDVKVTRPLPDAPTLAAGSVIQSWSPSLQSVWSVSYDPADKMVWVSSPSASWGGTDTLYEYTPEGTPTGRTYAHALPHAGGPADMAYNWNTGNLWIMNVEQPSCIYEIAPDTGYTGSSICPGGSGFAVSQRGLAYDPTTDTWFAGGWNDGMIHHFDANGTILDEVNVNLPIAGLAYNPDTEHLFVMMNSSPNPVFVLDAANRYALVGQFNISQGFSDYAGAGLEIACDGSLWAVDQGTDIVYQAASGEKTSVCSGLPWITAVPSAGQVGAGAAQTVELKFDTSLPEASQPGQYPAKIILTTDTPYPAQHLLVTMTVTAPADWGVISGAVTGLGYCDQNPEPLSEAEIVIQGSQKSYTITTHTDGSYQWYLPAAESPLSIQVTAAGHQPGQASGIHITPGGSTVQDFSLRWVEPCISTSPAGLEATLQLGDSTTLPLTLTNSGLVSTTFRVLEFAQALGALHPNPPGKITDPAEAAPASRSLQSPLAVGDMLGQVDVGTPTGDAQALGVEFAGGYWWVTGANNSADPNKLYKLDREGKLVATYDQPGSSVDWGWRDLAFDGRYLYASSSAVIDQIDPATGAVTGATIPSPVNPGRALTYDPASDHFWVANWNSDLYEIDRSGNIIHQFANNLQAYGLGWDAVSAGGPYLWIWSQDGTPAVLATQVNPATGLPTGVAFQGINLPTDGIAGGATVSTEIIPGKVVLAGLHQVDVDTVVEYELNVTGKDIPWLSEAPVTGTLAAPEATAVAVTFDTTAGITQTGVYTAQLQIYNDDPHGVVIVPVTMTVAALTYEMQLSPDASQSGKPGENLAYHLTVTNTSSFSAPDQYTVEVGTHDWPVTAPVTIGTVASGHSASFTVNVSIPASVLPGQSDGVTITVRSVGDPGKTGAARLATLASGTYGPELSPDASQGGKAGEPVSYQVYITNTSDIPLPDTFTLTLGTHNWTTTAPFQVGPLDPGAGTLFTVTVQIPADAPVGQSETVTLAARSLRDASKEAQVALTTEVISISNLKLYLPLAMR